MLSEKLKEATSLNHRLLEQKTVTLMRSVKNLDDHAVLIGIFYSFFGGVEQLIIKHIDGSKISDYITRRKTALLADDLISLTGALKPLADVTHLPAINNHLQALGALYVIEGSTLGGQIISKMIGKQLNIAEPAGMSFFNGYGDQTMAMWQQFKQDIDGVYSITEEEEVITAANDTFLKFGEWFDK